jgi:Leucine-rich repeat (LRR) protein
MSRIGLRSLDPIHLESLQNLLGFDASYNQIESVHAYQLEYFKSLQSIFLNNNWIHAIEKRLWWSCVNLKVVNLESNNLTEFNFVDFQIEVGTSAFTYVERISAKKNRIATIKDMNHISLAKLEKLVVLDLSFNEIDELILSHLFTELKVLAELYLNNNRLRVVSLSLLSSFRGLNMLRLESNYIAAIDAYSFYTLDILKTLDLSQNNLTSFELNVFAGLFQLKLLNLSCNGVEVIERTLLADMHNLVELDLSFNRLKRVEANALGSLGNLLRLRFNGNWDLSLSNQSLLGLYYIHYVEVSAGLLRNTSNAASLRDTLFPVLQTVKLNISYYKVINLIYKESEIGCEMTLGFIRRRVQLNLKTDAAVVAFLNEWRMFDLVLS